MIEKKKKIDLFNQKTTTNIEKDNQMKPISTQTIKKQTHIETEMIKLMIMMDNNQKC